MTAATLKTNAVYCGDAAEVLDHVGFESEGVQAIGRVGREPFGQMMLQHLRERLTEKQL